MRFECESNPGRTPRFRPPMEGCVARDRRLANAVKICYVDTFASIAANIYRSLVSLSRDRRAADLFDSIAEEELEHFRLLGELILALGGDAVLRGSRGTCVGGKAEGDAGEFLADECDVRQRNIDRYETLMGRTGDRVVRSVLAKLLSSERRILERCEQFNG